MNVIYINFTNKKLKPEMWNLVYKLDQLMIEKLTRKQFNELMGTRKYIDRAIKCKQLSKNKKVHEIANEIIDTINSIKEFEKRLNNMQTSKV